jgi:ATP-binding cassette subfamily B (MDR/TAP) protein 9
MCSRERQLDGSEGNEERVKQSYWKVWLFLFFLLVDAISSLVLCTPLFPFLRQHEGTTLDHYTFYGSFSDLAVLAILRLIAATFGLLKSYFHHVAIPESPFEPYHQNGDRKTREELDNEALEEPCCPWFHRYVSRPAFPCEVVCLVSGLVSVFKCLARLNYEIGSMSDSLPHHPIFWLALAMTTLCSTINAAYLDSVTKLIGKLGQRAGENTWMRRISSNLSIPLLSDHSPAQEEEIIDEEEAQDDILDENVRGTSDIRGDTTYKANWSDLLMLCAPDVHWIAMAFVFLLLAAMAQIYIPRFTGNILDALTETYKDEDDDANRTPIWDVPGFVSNVQKLIVASILCGIFSGVRGSIFTVVGGRVNVRLRVKLMDALLSQDIGFFDVTKTGDITSRLSSDTTLVGDQVTLNVNVFLRSLVQAIGVLMFMFIVSWQLSLLAFISVPVITVLSKAYGNYVRSLTKLMQKKLADGNTVSEASIGSMATVRAFDAGESELDEFEKCMQKYLDLNIRSAIAYLGYCTCVTSLPQLVTALVLFYGGLLVRNGDMTSGQLVSFLLYLQSLSDAFGSIGYIFSSLTQAVGAADKVFELMNRTPRLTPPAESPDACSRTIPRGIMGIEAKKTASQRNGGISPENCRGEVTLNDVELYYPARPQRCVLRGMSLTAKPGQVVALVGPSGSGKSSVMSLIQHLYEPSAGEVLVDGQKVHDLSPQWLSRNISVVSQEPTLFARSIRRNIMYGLEGTEFEPTDAEIREAARLANAASFIEKLPLGYEQEVGERGVQLSGGQKQRVAIARALVRKPRILLLDEATSALDAESEALVQEAIDHMLERGRETEGGMTVLIVAHRLSTVRNADVIFVVKDGCVVEKGKHDDLILDPNGAYSSLIRRQMKAQQKLEEG